MPRPLAVAMKTALALAAGGAAGATPVEEQWRTPPLLLGGCSTVWTTSFAKYVMPYPVQFGEHGTFWWSAPYKDGHATEYGEGMYLSTPVSIERGDGSWETNYFSANRFTPDPDNATLCACEYVGGAGGDSPRILADYIVARVPQSAGRPMQEVCAPFVMQCPGDNATAVRELGDPFVEVYATCGAAGYEDLRTAVLVVACAGAVALALRTLSRRCCRRQDRASHHRPSIGSGPLMEAMLTEEGDGAQVEALRRSIYAQLPPANKPRDSKDADGWSTPSTTASGWFPSPAQTEVSWSRSMSSVTIGWLEDLPSPSWSRSATEQFLRRQSASSTGPVSRQQTG
uniref:Uncharacterized protein n=1 Tax=Alexandrium monilatum TaxID=311494 RepID=A0A7S4UJL6_9DINO